MQAVAPPKRDRIKKDRPVRITEEAMRWAKIAAAFTGETLADYCSRVIGEQAQRDARRLSDEALGPTPAEPSDETPPAKRRK
jgi:hypothetical protein